MVFNYANHIQLPLVDCHNWKPFLYLFSIAIFDYHNYTPWKPEWPKHIHGILPTVLWPVSSGQALATRDADSFYVQDCRQAQLFETAWWLETSGNQQLERITSCIGRWRVKATKEKVCTWQISLVFSTRGSNDMKQLKRGRSLSKTTFEGYFTTSFHCCVANISKSQKCCHSSYPLVN